MALDDNRKLRPSLPFKNKILPSMSVDLVIRSLVLDIDADPMTGKKKGQATGSKNFREIIQTDRQGVQKKLRKIQKKLRKEVIEKRKNRKTKSAIEKYQDSLHDYTEASIEALQRLTELGKVEDHVAEKILYKQPCRLSKDIKEEISEAATSVFTEEDFQKFEKEYRPKKKVN